MSGPAGAGRRYTFSHHWKRLKLKLVGEYHLRRRGDDSMVPPPALDFVGGADFEGVGREFKEHFIRYGGLRPDSRVLDVGCGIGRMAVPLTDYLNPAGGYWGFDIVETGIRWCRSRISKRFANFHFEHADVYNEMYNQRGGVAAREYRFPYESDFFDLVFLTSVFTHLLPADLEHYLSEIARVLKPGGRSVITFFVLNAQSRALIASGASTRNIRHDWNGCWVEDPRHPEAAVGYDEARVRTYFDARGLTIVEPIHYGSWCGRQPFVSYQDLVVATKRNGPA
jgi:SAM-dependent methyltransferase